LPPEKSVWDLLGHSGTGMGFHPSPSVFLCTIPPVDSGPIVVAPPRRQAHLTVITKSCFVTRQQEKIVIRGAYKSFENVES
jgi:hypothetical protein